MHACKPAHQHIHLSSTCAHLYTALKELTEDLNSVAADWFELGVQLDIEDGELRGVSGKENAAAKCFQKTLSLWWRSGTPTLKAVTDALRSSVIGHNNLARKLEKGLCILPVLSIYLALQGLKLCVHQPQVSCTYFGLCYRRKILFPKMISEHLSCGML